jgi:hypothetical protein
VSGEADQVDALQGDDDGNLYELSGEGWLPVSFVASATGERSVKRE